MKSTGGPFIFRTHLVSRIHTSRVLTGAKAAAEVVRRAAMASFMVVVIVLGWNMARGLKSGGSGIGRDGKGRQGTAIAPASCVAFTDSLDSTAAAVESSRVSRL